MRTNPHILEINTARWLAILSRRYGKKMTICHIPDEALDNIKAGGFDAVWLMGLWQRSPKALEIARNHAEISRAVSFQAPGYQKEDITASPYAVYDYSVDRDMGTEDGLIKLKKRLNDRGIMLLLDFVGNHFAVDHPKTLTDPDLFINTGTTPPVSHPDWFFKTDNGVYIAHGRDPFFPPWADTAQLNYFNPKTQDFMLQTLERVASFCDGVRCDMSMLSLNKVHHDTWWQFLKGDKPREEFWTRALARIKDKYPSFVFIAEVYWGLEWDIQELGFDYTYDKVLYDRLRFSSAENIKAHLGAEHLYQMRSIRFISNHDEESALKAFGRDKSLAAAVLMSTIPGARMFYIQQILGYKTSFPIQYVGPVLEQDIDKSIHEFYSGLLAITNNPSFHGGQWTLKQVSQVNDSETYKNVLTWEWAQGLEYKLVVINYSDVQSVCKVPFKIKCKSIVCDFPVKQTDLPSEDICKNGLTLELKPYESRIYTLYL